MLKKIITIISLGIVMTAHAQHVVKDSAGNYRVIAGNSSQETTGKPTGQYITDKEGVKHPVYVSARGKLYYMRTAKSGNVYKSYIKTN